MPGIRTQLSAPVLTINNKVIAYIGNSLKVKDGNHGVITVTNLTSGGASRTKNVALDTTTLVDEITFELSVNKETYDDVNNWKNLAMAGTPSAITISQGSTAKSYNNMFMTEQPEFGFAADGKITCTFK